MVKTMIKEIMITLLLCVIILFVLCVLFYDYNPINKVVPNKVPYSVPENVRNDIEEQKIENTINIENKIYTVEGSDLNIYKKSDSYQAGKANPFASSPSVNTNVSTSQNPNNNINTGDNKSTSQNANTKENVSTNKNTNNNNTTFWNTNGKTK